MMALSEKLVKVLEDEIPLMRTDDIEAHKYLLHEKQRLSIDYMTHLKSIAQRPDMLKELPDDKRTALRASGERLKAATEKNALELRAASVATQRLIQSIVSAVREQVLPKQGYSHTASQSSSTHYSPTCKPVAFSETV
jgi:hypothetical protein